MSRNRLRRGVTLIEAIIVVAIIGLMASISFPAVSAGLDSIRLQSAADQVAGFLNAALNRAERRQEVVEVVIEPQQNRMALYSTDASFQRTADLPQNVRFVDEAERHLVLMPGAAFPRFTVELVNVRGTRKLVSLDAITGVPRISIPAAPQ